MIVKKCSKCGQSLKIKNDTVETRRLLKIMKKNNLTKFKLSKILDVSESTIYSWFVPPNSGKIKDIYFDILKNKGFI